MGKEAVLKWMQKNYTVQKLLEKELLPMAYEGLRKANIDNKDIEFLLGIIKSRLKHQSGSEWIIKNYRMLKDNVKKDDALRLLTRAIYKNQINNLPVHKWPPVKADGYLKEVSHLVGHIMSTQLFTVQENDLASLATNLMKWKNIHHVPVENEQGKLSGLLTWTHVQKFKEKEEESHIVANIMQKKVITVQPETHIFDAIYTMKKHKIGCLPVLKNNDLVGIITIKDVIEFDND